MLDCILLFLVSSIAWDLLRIVVYGFNAFCTDFLSHHPNHFVSPLRVSGSAVETLFSQFKYAAGGKLDAANYFTARTACLHGTKSGGTNPSQWQRLLRHAPRYFSSQSRKKEVQSYKVTISNIFQVNIMYIIIH